MKTRRPSRVMLTAFHIVPEKIEDLFLPNYTSHAVNSCSGWSGHSLFHEHLNLWISPPVDTCPASCVPMGTAVFEVRYLCTGVAVFSLWHGRLGAVSMSIATLLVLQCTSTPVPRAVVRFHFLVDMSPASCVLMGKTAFEVSALEWLCLACGMTGQANSAQRREIAEAQCV